MSEVLSALEEPGIERLVIDLRHNKGGNSAVLAQFVPQLAARVAPRALRVLIGPCTFSSGMTNAQELRAAGARLYGEPTGGKPNSYDEVQAFSLPRSGLRVSYSTKLCRPIADGDPPSVEPDVLVPLSSADYFAGVDPVLERALLD